MSGVTLQGATGIANACTGSFTDEQNSEIVVSRGNILELLRPNENGKIQSILLFDVVGEVRSLASFQLPGSQKDYIVVGSADDIVFLDYNKEKNTFDKVHQESFGEFGCSGIVPSQFLAVDPKGRAVMIGTMEKQKLVYVLNCDKAGRLTVSSPLEAHKMQTICSVVGVDCGFDNPIFAAIELNYMDNDQGSSGQAVEESQKHLTFYELDFGLNQLNRKWSEPIDNRANLLVQVPGGGEGPGGVLVCADNFVVFKNQNHPDVRAAIPRREDLPPERNVRLVAAGQHRQKSLFLVFLQTECGDVFRVTLKFKDGTVEELIVKYFDTIAISSALCVLKTEFLFAASEIGNHVLYQFQSRVDDIDSVHPSSSTLVEMDEGDQPVFSQAQKLQNLILIDKVECLTPIMDTHAVNISEETLQTQEEEMKRDGQEEMSSGSSSEESESSSDGSEDEEEETMYDSEFRESGGSSSASSSESESDSEEDYVEVQEEKPRGVPGGKPQHAHPKLDLPPVPKVDLKLQPNQGLMSMGSISAVMGAVVVVESTGQQRVLDAGSVLWLQKARTPLGLVDDLFGPVQRPFYSVRFNDPSEIPAGAEVGVRVGYNAEHAQFVLDDANLHKKGCDASGAHDEELPENEIEFSDDEREQEAKKRKQKRKAPKKETVKSLETERRQRAPQVEAERPQRGPQEGRGDGGRGGRGRARARGRSRPDHSQHANSGPHPDMHFHELEARRRHESYRDHEPPHLQHHNQHQQQWQPPLPPHPPPSHGPPRPHFNSVAPPLPPGLHPQEMATHPHAVPNLAQQPWPPLPEQPMLPRLVHQPPLPESMRPPTSFLHPVELTRPVSAVSYAPFQFSAPQTLGTEAMVLCNPAPPLPVNPPMPAGRPSHESMMHSSVSHAHVPPMPPGMSGAQGMIQSALQPQLHSQIGSGMPGSGPPPPQGSWMNPMPQMLPGHVAQPGVGQFAPRPW